MCSKNTPNDPPRVIIYYLRIIIGNQLSLIWFNERYFLTHVAGFAGFVQERVLVNLLCVSTNFISSNIARDLQLSYYLFTTTTFTPDSDYPITEDSPDFAMEALELSLRTKLKPLSYMAAGPSRLVNGTHLNYVSVLGMRDLCRQVGARAELGFAVEDLRWKELAGMLDRLAQMSR